MQSCRTKWNLNIAMCCVQLCGGALRAGPSNSRGLVRRMIAATAIVWRSRLVYRVPLGASNLSYAALLAPTLTQLHHSFACDHFGTSARFVAGNAAVTSLS